MSAWLSVVGIGEDGLNGLSPAARRLLDDAEVLVGGARHLAMVPEDGRERIAWPRPMDAAIPEIAGRRGHRVCVLASGDPSNFGVARKLLKAIPLEEITILPAPSAFSLAAARLGWSLPDVACITLHWREVEALHPYILPGRRIIALSRDGATPGQVAALLRGRDYGQSRLSVLARMEGAEETRVDGLAETWQADDLPDLNVVGIDCVAGEGALLLPSVPGLPDDAYKHDGQLTKREVRAATLAALAPLPGQRLWDVGAGCGSIAIEWMRAAPNADAVSIERDPARAALIETNAMALGAPGLTRVTGEAPAALDGLPQPDAVFLGGGLTTAGLFERCWDALPTGGRLVANAVTLEGEGRIADWRAKVGGELCRIAVSRAEPVGRLSGWRPLMPVTQFSVVKS